MDYTKARYFKSLISSVPRPTLADLRAEREVENERIKKLAIYQASCELVKSLHLLSQVAENKTAYLKKLHKLPKTLFHWSLKECIERCQDTYSPFWIQMYSDDVPSDVLNKVKFATDLAELERHVVEIVGNYVKDNQFYNIDEFMQERFDMLTYDIQLEKEISIARKNINEELATIATISFKQNKPKYRLLRILKEEISVEATIPIKNRYVCEYIITIEDQEKLKNVAAELQIDNKLFNYEEMLSKELRVSDTIYAVYELEIRKLNRRLTALEEKYDTDLNDFYSQEFILKSKNERLKLQLTQCKEDMEMWSARIEEETLKRSQSFEIEMSQNEIKKKPKLKRKVKNKLYRNKLKNNKT